MRQFPTVSCKYGAPMGRHSVPDLDTSPRSVRLFAVRLDRGGCDDGGAYWGLRPHGMTLWCAMDESGDMQTVDASCREHAAMLLDIPAPALIVGFCWRTVIMDMIEGRRALPSGWDMDDANAYLRFCLLVEGEK